MSEATEFPSLSIIVPVHNNHRHLPAALASIRAQEVAGCEVIVVDDGSEPPISSLVEAVLPEAILVRQHNGGPSAARNRGLRQATGEFVAFLDADDLWSEEALTVLAKGFRDAPGADVIQGHVRRFGDPTDVSAAPPGIFGHPYLGFNVGALMARRAALFAAGLFDESLRQSEDVDLFIRLRETGARHLIIPNLVLQYRLHQDSLTMTQQPKSLKHGAAENWIRLVRNSVARRRSSGVHQSAETAEVPRVSVLLVVRDGRKYLPAALASIRAQTLPAAEIVAVVGASADGTADYLRVQDDVRVVVQSGEGLAAARNQAVTEAREPFLAFLDHDDLWHERKLEMQAKAIELFVSPAASITNFRLVRDTGSADPTVVDRSDDALPRLGWTPSALLFQRDVFHRIGGFDPSLGMGCDTDWFRRLRLSGTPIGVASQVLMEKRVHDNNLSRENERNRQAMFRMLGKHRGELRAARSTRDEGSE